MLFRSVYSLMADRVHKYILKIKMCFSVRAFLLTSMVASTNAACAQLREYEHSNCSGNVISMSPKFETTTDPKAQTECLSGPFDNGFNGSITGQYCDVAANVFHQTVYLTKHCSGFAMHQSFTTDGCTYGWQLVECSADPCPQHYEEGIQYLRAGFSNN